ncbi:MAG TPA: glycosyltransferase [Candidatus Aquilonibacter sp.]|nr:glycosyltransferase [Candidatus Aquilonibacter sp.]
MSLTVLSIAFPFAPVGPYSVGGAERILSELDAALVAEGQRSLVAACAGSLVAGELFPAPLPERSLASESDRRWYRWRFQAAIDRALSKYRVDLIHMHGLDFDEHVLPPGIPTLVTLHARLSRYRSEAWASHCDVTHFQCVSHTQRRGWPGSMGDVSVIQHGVAIRENDVNRQREEFAVSIGRICPEKNVHEALEAGTLAGTRVLIGGHLFPFQEHGAYFRQRVEPLLGRDDVKHSYLGPLDANRSRRLLARARCLLLPSLTPEASSLIAMESLAAGTPVIAYRSGALTEIVEDRVTGFLVNNVEEMAEAIRNIDQISHEACRAAAEERFSRDRMVRHYFDLYGALLTGDRQRMCA